MKLRKASYAFRLPVDFAQAAVRLIGAVPATWGWVGGQLDAPLSMVAEGEVAGAGLKLGSLHSEVEVHTLYDLYARGPLDRPLRGNSEEGRLAILMYRRNAVLELLAERRLPLFVNFSEAGAKAQEFGFIPLESAKQIAITYVNLGYLGDLFFRSFDGFDDETARVDIHLAPYHGHAPIPRKITKTFNEVVAEIAAARAAGDVALARQISEEHLEVHFNHFPPLIYLERRTDDQEVREQIESLAAYCRQIGLKELEADKVEFGMSYMDRF